MKQKHLLCSQPRNFIMQSAPWKSEPVSMLPEPELLWEATLVLGIICKHADTNRHNLISKKWLTSICISSETERNNKY